MLHYSCYHDNDFNEILASNSMPPACSFPLKEIEDSSEEALYFKLKIMSSILKYVKIVNYPLTTVVAPVAECNICLRENEYF